MPIVSILSPADELDRGQCASLPGNRREVHVEGGKRNTPKIVDFQLRPDPLAD